MCLSCKRTRNDSWSCCSAIGQKKTKVFWHQSEARTSRTVWNWSFKTLSPGALLRLLDFSSPEFFFARFDFFPPPLTAPGSPRMFAILNKQGHIINGNIPVALRCVTFFSHTSEPTSVLFSYKRASNYITDNQYFSLLMFWQIRYVH